MVESKYEFKYLKSFEKRWKFINIFLWSYKIILYF